jgi:hypothetical protein
LYDQRFISIDSAIATAIANNAHTAAAAGQLEPRITRMTINAMQMQRAKRAALFGLRELGVIGHLETGR